MIFWWLGSPPTRTHIMLQRLLDRELGVVRHNDRLGQPPPRIYVLQRPIRP